MILSTIPPSEFSERKSRKLDFRAAWDYPGGLFFYIVGIDMYIKFLKRSTVWDNSKPKVGNIGEILCVNAEVGKSLIKTGMAVESSKEERENGEDNDPERG